MDTLQVCVNGKPVKQYRHQGKVFIEARDGTEYTLRIRNNSFLRRLAVTTIDGINAVSGDPQGNEVGRGYIIPASSSIEIKGFRQDLNSVGTFKFCNKDRSYGNSQGAGGNNGVIGVRMYDEKQKPMEYSWTCTSSNSLPNILRGFGDNPLKDPVITCSSFCCDSGKVPNQKSTPDFSLGTTWGEKVNDRVVLTDFEYESYFSEECILYYDTRKNLESIGISFKEEKQVNAFPQAFGGFAKPPKNWHG